MHRPTNKLPAVLVGVAALLMADCSGFSAASPDATAPSAPSPTAAPTPTASSQITAVAFDAAGNVYETGYIEGTAALDWGNGVAVTGSNSQTSCFLAKLSSDFKPLWVRTQVAGDSAQFSGLVVDGTAVYAVGTVSGAAAWAPGVEAPGTLPRGVVVKFDQDGTPLWARSPSQSPHTVSLFRAAAIDAAGNLYIAGSTRSPPWLTDGSVIDFGGGVSFSGRSSNVLLVKFSPQGTAQWVRTETDSSDNPNPEFVFQSVVCDQNAVYAAGSIEAETTVDFGSGVTVHGNGNFYGNAVLVKYDLQGQPQWARTQTSGEDSAEFTSVAVNGSGIFVAGDVYDRPVGFGSGATLPGSGSANAAIFVVVRYGFDGTAVWARAPVNASDGSSTLSSLIAGPDKVYGAGWTASRSVDMGGGVSVGGLFHPGSGNLLTPQSLLLVGYDLSGSPVAVQSVNGDVPSFYSGLAVNPVTGTMLAAGGVLGASLLSPSNGTVVNRAKGSESSAILVRY